MAGFAWRALLLALAAAHTATGQCTTPWQPVASGEVSPVAAIAALPDGDLVVGGPFTMAGSVVVNGIARWDGAAWWPLGSGMSGSVFPPGPATVLALLVLPDGDIVAAGNFTAAGGVAALSIARWDGIAWSAFGTGLAGIVHSLAVLPNGDIVAGGLLPAAGATQVNHIARWDGSEWHALGTGVNTYFVEALAVLPNGDLIAGGNFFAAGGVPAERIARWDGVAWWPLGSGMSAGGAPTQVWALKTLPNGDLIAGGNFTFAGGVAANRIARWDGAAWFPLGSGVEAGSLFETSVSALSVLPNGDVLAAGRFTIAGGVAAERIARWNGAVWAPVGGLDAAANELATMPNGDRIASGNFTMAGGVPVAWLARLTTTCPATADSYGADCIGTPGMPSLSADSLPWIGSTFGATATGLSANALAVGVFGFGQMALPMPAVHPLGAPGCELLVSDEILLQFLVANGRVATSIDVPDSAAIVGGVFHHQVVQIELDEFDEIVALTSTNGMTLTVGVF